MERGKNIVMLRPLSNTPTSLPGDSPSYEPAFFVPSITGLDVVCDRYGKNAEFLSQAIAKKPTQLKSHVLRIGLQIRDRNSDGVWGALIDLFLVLQCNGRALRQRLLESSRNILGDTRYRYLRAHLEEGLSSHCARAEDIHSVLAKEQSGPLQLLRKQDHSAEMPRDPLLDALDHIEYGQIAEAQQVLEQAVVDDPLRSELHRELLAIYRSTRDQSAFLSMRVRLATSENPVVGAWAELAEFFKGEPRNGD
jgi:hypothetical protein